MAFGSKIDITGIDKDFPKAKQANSTQGFRDNFASIADNLGQAADEISRIQNKFIKVEGDVVGVSSYIAEGSDPLKIKLCLTETGVVAGTYDAAKITVDIKGRIVSVEDGSNTYVNQTGDTMTGDLVMKNANIHVDDGFTVAGRDLTKDGLLLDRINTKSGILVRQADGVFTGRHLEAIDGLRILNHDGVQGPPTVGIKGFNLVVRGDVKGSVKVKNLEDIVLNLRLDTNEVLSTTGGKMMGTLDLNGNYLKGAKEPIYGTHIGDRDYNDARYLRSTLGNAAGFVVQRRPGTETAPREIKGVSGITVRHGDGFDGNPEIGASDFKLTFQGDVRGSGVVKGLSNAIIQTQLPNHYTKSEADDRFITKTGDAIKGDLYIRGSIVFPDGGVIDGRDLKQDGAVVDKVTGVLGGVMIKVGDNLVGRTLVGQPDQIDIVNGDGALGNPVISLASNLRVGGRRGLKVPCGRTYDRGEHETGLIRYNEETTSFEVCEVTGWNEVMTVSHGELPCDAKTVWLMNRSRTMTLFLDKPIELSVDGCVAGHTYVLFIHQDDVGGHDIKFADMIKFPGGKPRLTTVPNATDVIEFHCDGKYLYGFIRHNFC